MKSLLVSVIVPNYNHAPYLRQRIETILNQTYQNKEIILLDDASTDGSDELLKLFYRDFYPHPISHLIVNDQNSGSPFMQWKRGIELAKGTLIWIAESDDYSSPFFLERMVAAYCNEANEKSSGLLFSGSYSVNQNNELLDDKEKVVKFNSIYPNPVNYIDKLEFVNKCFVVNPVITNASAVVFERNLYPLNSTHITKMKQSGDMMTWLLMLQRTDVVYVNEKLNYHRRHAGSVTHQNAKRTLTVRKELVLFLTACSHLEGVNLKIIQNRLEGLLKKVLKELLSLNWNYIPFSLAISGFLVKVRLRRLLR